MDYFSAFTGIGGFDAAFNRHGMRATATSEIDAGCRKVLARQFPDTPHMEDIANVDARTIGRPRIFVGGFPCQDTSIAAPNRLGLHGARSGMYREFVRLLDDYMRLVDSVGPRFVVIENPTGLLKSNGGRDMAAVVGSLENLGYGWAYRVVDGRDFGSPQRRERVIVVGHRGGDPRPAWEVLGNDGPSREVAATDRVSGEGGQGRRRVVGSPADAPGVTVWRKSARARASLAAGGYETWVADGKANTLAGFDGGLATRQTHLIAQGGRLRTLTLTEWERLQGFEDGWTANLPDSARYTALGNAMHVGMADWLARRLVAVESAVPALF